MAVSSIAEIIAITSEQKLIEEMALFEKALDKRVEPIEKLLQINVRAQSDNEVSVEDHMTAIESKRQSAVRYHALAACFLEHAKSPYFRLKKGNGVSEDDRRSKEKMLVAPFEGLSVRTEGLIKSIDSRAATCAKSCSAWSTNVSTDNDELDMQASLWQAVNRQGAVKEWPQPRRLARRKPGRRRR